MNQFTKSFLRLSLLLAIGVVSGLQAASCDDCSDVSLQSCNTSCDTSCNTSCDTSCGTSCITSDTCGSCCHSVYIPRSTVSNTAYFWFPWRKDIDCEMNGIVELGFEYQRSFSGKKIARSLFGSECLHFQGSAITGASRDPNALIADNFGLSQSCDTSIAFKPRIQNYNLNFHGRLGLDNWVEGLYGEVYFAFTHQKRSLGLVTTASCNTSCNTSCNNSFGCSNASFGCSTDCSTGCSTSCSTGCSTGCSTTNSCDTSCNNSFNNCSSTCLTTSLSGACTIPFPAGYMGAGVVPTVSTLQQALTGQTIFGDMRTPWAFGQFPFCSQTKNAVAGVALVAGWNFWQSDCGHLGAFFQYVAPTGNKPDPRVIFGAVVGNGKHHELGGGISAHYDLWNNDCDQSLTAYLDGYVVSMLRNCQLRSFDFQGKGCLSRYMLLEAVTPATGNPTAYASSVGLINGINFATRYAKVKVAVKGDATLRFVYSNGGFNFGFGYNIYGQSKESLYLTDGTVKDCNGIAVLNPAVGYAFKGCATLYADGIAIAPAVTQSTATIRSCGVNDVPAAGIQTPVVAAASDSCSTSCSTGCSTDCSGTTSDTLCTGVLNLSSGEAPKQFTNKGFATLDYTWAECDYAPYLGIGAEAEGGSRFSLNQWGVWIKGGIQF